MAPLEPMLIEDIIIERGRGFFISLKNVRSFRVSNFKIEKLRANAENLNIDAIINIPNVKKSINF